MPKLHPSQYAELLTARTQLRNRIPCSQCAAMATWYYLPSDGGIARDRAYCDQHVPRGCSCSDGETDHDGKEMPCIEYGYDQSGFRPAPALGRQN